MGIENFIRDALFKPNDYIAYHVGRELAELYPGKTILEGQNWYFDLESFVNDEKCSVVEDKSVFHHVRVDWDGPGQKLKPRIQNSWLNVLWQGHLLEVLLITWIDVRCPIRHHWIVTEERKIAEEFYNAVCAWSCEVRGEILVYQDGYFQKDQQLHQSIKTATFDNLILPETLKRQIQDDFQRFFDSREVYERYGIPWKRGAIFIGPPGNGKTHTLKALINQLGKPCIYVRDFQEDEESMAEVFKRARMVAPCFVVLEDLDSMINDETRSFFLNELDGFRSNTGVVVLATTNHPEKLDAAILDRPSRFDRKYHFTLPSDSERLAYLRKWNDGLQPDMRVTNSVAIEIVARIEGFSFAYLKELLVASMMEWVSGGGSVSMDEVIRAQTELLLSQISKKEKSKAAAG
ncbi:MAG TPA: ATP-binding protein [Pyrinomonadaceae bacterium]|nr:ATP-binding protein [Pyrinomonadaceae bacterium]